MRFGLTRAGFGDVGSDERLIELAGAHGFATVDVNPAGLVERHGKEGAVELLRRSGVALSSFGLPVEWRTTEEAFRDGLTKLQAAAEAAAALGCTSCCTYILPSTDEKPAAFMAVAVRRLRLCAQMLGAYGIRLGLEYVGPHHLRTRWQHPFIWTMEETQAFADAIGERNVGLLLDAYHWYTTGQTTADLALLRPSDIVHVHINDAKPVPVEEALDNDRLLPGEGVIDLAGFLRSLQSTGYDGAVTIEVLTPSAPTDAPEQLVSRAKAGLDKARASAGLA